MQTIKQTCDLIRQLKINNISKTDEDECLLELNVLINRLCLCDIPNLPVQLNHRTVQAWAEVHAIDEIEEDRVEREGQQRTSSKTASVHEPANKRQVA